MSVGETRVYMHRSNSPLPTLLCVLQRSASRQASRQEWDLALEKWPIFELHGGASRNRSMSPLYDLLYMPLLD